MRPPQLSLAAVAATGGGYLGLRELLPPTAREEFAMLAQVVVMTACAVLLGRRAVMLPGRSAAAWWAVAAASSASALIFVILFGYEAANVVAPVPSSADVPYFASVLLVIVAVLLLPRRPGMLADRLQILLDATIIVASLLTISWQLSLGPVVERLEGVTAEAAVLLAYPILDVVALTVAVVVASRSTPVNRRALALLAAGVLALAAGDSAYGFLSLTGAWDFAHPATVLWLIAFPLMAVGAYQYEHDPAGPETAATTRARVLLLALPALAALAVTGTQGNLEGAMDRAIVSLLLLILARQVIAVLGELQLRAGLEQQVYDQTESLRLQVYLDPVTGLGNRVMLRDRAGNPRTMAAPLALLLLDLDGFKEVNDTLGHEAGDRVLMLVGERLGALTRAADTVVRMGGDEFVLVLPATERRAALATAGRVLTSVAAPLVIGGSQVSVGCSIGVALATADVDIDELLRQADLAMYEAKATGGGEARVFDPEMHSRLVDRLRAESEVRAAVVDGQFSVYYQPIVDVQTGAVACLEALARWDHPERGLVSPFEFIGLAERAGCMVELGDFVLRTACRQVQQWRADWPELTVAVNLSHAELVDPGLVGRIQGALASSDLPPAHLHLEVTETVLASAADIGELLEQVVGLGVSLSLDDFGTGHSSLSRVRELKVDRLKIDKSFISEIVGGKAALLSSIIALGDSLEMRTVAEGVETQEQLDFLTSAGCDEVQGYLFSRPVPAPHVIPLLFSIRVNSVHSPAAATSLLPGVVWALDHGRFAEPVQDLLRELSSLSGLETMFVTTVADGSQVTHYANNESPQLTIEPGLSVPWENTLCKRIYDSGVLTSCDVQERYADVAAVRELGIASYVSVPITDDSGSVVGTLCGASPHKREIDDLTLSLLEFFVGLIAEPVAALAKATAKERAGVPSD